MKTIVSVSLVGMILISGCGVPKPEYDKLRSEADSLKAELDECRFGADRLIATIEKAYAEGDYGKAKQNIQRLSSEHPESPKTAEFKELLRVVEMKELEQKRRLEAEEKERTRLANVGNLGMWKVSRYVDEFGEPTKKGYVTNTLPIVGTFSNSATQDSRLHVSFLISNPSDISIKLYEYAGNNPVKGYSSQTYSVKVKDSKGQKYGLSAVNYSDRLSFDNRDSKKVHRILMAGGQIQFWIMEDNTPTTQYQFAIENADWYENACTKLAGQ